MKLSEIVNELIQLGDASQAYWEREVRKYHPRYPLVYEGEPEVPPSSEDDQILALLTSLPDDQFYAVALLTYIGRGDFNADNLPRANSRLKEWLLDKDVAIARLTASKSLGEDLTDAVEEFKKRRIDLDSIEFTNALAVS